ncbi:MAG: SDR family oxidoreductase [Candidatus Omnitrophica bacterium]|nr:SDR family oxidoreductase [Candidatus Omnitrophota bacterium]MBU4303823.1 SDR family oxidoreductase [Candidatus Omnitrophota bacterium]MBU4418895.1 SDR family oxidoreductase [Candidatus Omnitrophota bacterium]MBU4468014.1 SDR family oxidoreductase [Candidatus Omnitrophota bacterium]MCG2707811.1 SDR family oxidoreductase [Candidatus Omnitrophota bacterium]
MIIKQEKINNLKYSEKEIQDCISLLRDLVADTGQLVFLTREQRIELITVTGQLSRPDRDEIRKRKKDCQRVKKQKIDHYQRVIRASTGIRSARQAAVFSAPRQITGTEVNLGLKQPELITPRACYICKSEFKRLHFFYDALCPRCADFNYQKRFQTTSLDGQIALITGSRLKIGYQAALMMLRAGARVIATTRFPVDSALRYSREPDFPKWSQRLHIYGLDLRHTPSVEIFCNFIYQEYDRLDILVNNAAQTVRRPPGFYAHLMENENIKFQDLPEAARLLLGSFQECKKKLLAISGNHAGADLALPIAWNQKAPGVGLFASAKLSQVPYAYDHTLSAENVFPQGKLDADSQQVDLRQTNSWRLCLGQISTAEMIEIQLVNAIAPFVLCNKLSAMMKRQNTGQKHIVNVSAMEGKFTRYIKTERHPHTNMAKAALNMLTHTSASDLAKSGIFMNSVDTGWVTDEDPAALSMRKQARHDFQPPLDIIDGAARVCDPFFDGMITGKHWCGKFLKDYFPVAW